MIKRIYIFDIDGTLVDSSHRYRTIWKGEKVTIDFPHWLENSHLFAGDSILPLGEWFRAVNGEAETYTIWITARGAEQMRDSLPWLVSKLGNPDKIFFRPSGNNESGATLKVKQLSSFLNLRQFQNVPRYFYEDNRDYLAAVEIAGLAKGIYIASNQGH